MSRRRSLGFTLIELILALGLLTVVAVAKFREMIDESDRAFGVSAGQHIVSIGAAADAFIARNAVALSAAATTVVTVADLKAAGLLEAGFSENNPWGSPYAILVRRQGAGPFTFTGLVSTTNPLLSPAGNARLDILGSAIQAIGGSGGMSYAANQVSGANGNWTAAAADYPAITAIGQLAYRLQAAPYDGVYLRLDGMFPMTGTLNAGGQNIANANNVTGSGNLSGANVFASTQVATHAGTPTAIGAVRVSANGDNLTTTGSATVGNQLVVSAGGASINGNTSMTGNATVSQNLGVDGLTRLGPAGSAATNLVLNGDATLANLSGVYANARQLSEVSSRSVWQDSWHVTHGSSVTKPACGAGGTPTIFVIPQNLDSANGVYNFVASDAGASWSIIITDGAGVAQALGRGIAVAMCAY